MVRVLGALRPTRVDEGVMQKLLHVVNNPLFEINWILREHAQAGNRFSHHLLMARTEGRNEILFKQESHTLCVRRGDRTLLFPAPSEFLAGRAIRHAIANDHVTPAEHLKADDAKAEIVQRPRTLPALRADKRGVTLPHGCSLSE